MVTEEPRRLQFYTQSKLKDQEPKIVKINPSIIFKNPFEVDSFWTVIQVKMVLKDYHSKFMNTLVQLHH